MSNRSGRFTLIQQNDLHGQLDVHWEHFWTGDGAEYRRVGGMARAASAVRWMQGDADAAMLIDCGDALHGTLPVIRSEGQSMVRALNAQGVGLLVPGNWDYGYGPEVLLRRAEELDCPVIAANVQTAEDASPVFPATHVRDLNGVRVGFVGLTSPIVPHMSPRFAAGLRFLDARRVLPGAVRRLREEERCDVVVLASHVGFSQDLALVREIDGIDVVLSAHTHNRIERPVVAGGTILIQSGFSGSFLGRLDLEVANGRMTGWHHRLIELSDEFAPDAEVARVVTDAIAPFRQEMEEVVGRTEVPLNRMGLLETSMDNLIVASYQALTGADLALSRGWRFAPPVPEGPVTMGDLWSMIPTNPEVFTARMTGAQIRGLIEANLQDVFAGDPHQQAGGYVVRAAGLSVVFRPNNGRGARIEQLSIGGAQYDPDRVYTVAAAGGQDVPSSLPREATGVTALDALRRYLGSTGAVRPEVTGRVFIAQ